MKDLALVLGLVVVVVVSLVDILTRMAVLGILEKMFVEQRNGLRGPHVLILVGKELDINIEHFFGQSWLPCMVVNHKLVMRSKRKDVVQSRQIVQTLLSRLSLDAK
jgi:hypothetical protein